MHAGLSAPSVSLRLSSPSSIGDEDLGGTRSRALLPAHRRVHGHVRRERGAAGRDRRPRPAHPRIRGGRGHLDLPVRLGRNQCGKLGEGDAVGRDKCVGRGGGRENYCGERSRI